MELSELRTRSGAILDEVERAVVGKRDALELILLAILSDGHVLLEDYPGLAKTLIARSFSRATSLQFARLALAGAFNRAATVSSGSEVRLSIRETDSNRRLLEPLGDDRGLPLKAGTVAYCSPTTANTDITIRFILAGTPAADSRCVGFARIAGGENVLRAIHEAPAGTSAFVSSLEPSR